MSPYAHKVLSKAMPLHQAGRFAEAEAAYRQVLAQEPKTPDALHLLGVLLHQTGKTGEGVEYVRRAIALRPNAAEYHVNAGTLLRAVGRLEEGLGHFEAAARINPNIPELHNNVANLHSAMNHLELAEQALGRALKLRPNFAEAHVNLGNLAVRKGKLDDALAAFDRALRMDPNSAEGLTSLGNVLGKLGRTEEALGALRRSAQINPRASKTRGNLGAMLQARGLLDESLREFGAAVSLDPVDAVAFSNLLFALNRDPRVSAEEVFETHRDFGQRFEPAGRAPHPNGKDPGRRLKVGYVSADFRKHSVAYFLEPVLRHHDREQFEVICYSNVTVPDGVSERMRGLVDGWFDITRLSDAEAAALVRSHGVDVLVDLSGHTEGNRLLVFARRPAPVQVTYLGYPNTTGLAAVGWRVTDGVADPAGVTDGLHTERLVRLPRAAWCYEPPADAPEVVDRPRGAREVVFGSFNTFAKVSPWLMGVWARVLGAAPGSRLVLKGRAFDDAGTRAHAMGVFERLGVAGRVELLAWDPSSAGHLGTYGRIDIALDTYPYHGTTTTCEALYMGVPVVTLEGKTHASRVGVSLLSSVGLGELVAKSEEEYVAIAAGLAGDRARVAELRRTLRGRMLGSALCDGAGLTRDLEAAYRTAWRAWCETGDVPGA